MKTDWKWAAIAVIVWANFPSAAHARCYEPNFPHSCTTADGCPGVIDCVGGYPTKCMKVDPACPVPHNTIHVDGIEIVQEVQDINNSVTLVAAKPTLARVYLSTTRTTPITVTGTLTAVHGSTSVSIASSAAINITHDNTLRQQRESLPLSLNFVLPANVRASGDTTFTVSQIRDATNIVLQCVNCNVGKTVTFKKDTPLRLRIIGLSYNVTTPTTPPVTTIHTPRQIDFDLLLSWLRRAYPISTLATSQVTVATTNTTIPSCIQANGQLAAMRGQDMDNGGDQRTHYLGLVSNGGNYMRGCASDVPPTANPAIVASSPTGNPTFNAPINVAGDNDATFGDWYGGHELAHTFGRNHPGFCNGNSNTDTSFPYPNGQITDESGTYTGLDFGDVTQGIAQRALPGASTFDIMTYCNQPQWLSAYAYNGILQRLADEDATFGAPPGAGAVVGGSFVHVVANVDLVAQTGHFAYVNPISKALPQPVGDGRAELVTLTLDGQVIRRYPVRLLETTDIPAGEHQTALVDAAVPLSPSLGEIQLSLFGKSIASFRASQNRPLAPKEMRVMREKTKTVQPLALSFHALTWKMPRMAKEHITYIVQVSQNGRTWETIGVGIEKSTIALSAAHAASSFIRVIATNGFLSSEPVLLHNQKTKPRQQGGRTP